LKFALFLGCTIQTEQYAYEISARKVLPKLGIELVDLDDANCCGYPIKGINTLSWIYLSARNLALAEKLGIDVLPLCNGCELSLCETKYYLENELDVRDQINALLKTEGLQYTGKVNVIHILNALYDLVGVDKIKKMVKKPLKGFRFASHYGCHAILTSNLKRADDSEDPKKLEELIRALGADSEYYPERLDCCGSGLAMVSGKTTLSIAGSKILKIQDYGFDGMITVCPFCMKIFDGRQKVIRSIIRDSSLNLPILYYTQLLGLSMGIKAEELGLDLNLSSIDAFLEKVIEV
jgi:heterodisulfide reductase subunit B